MTDSSKLRPISEAQARKLAWAWENPHRTIGIGTQYIDPTDMALLKRGLISPKGEPELSLSGQLYQPHVVNAKGLRALADFLQRESLK